MQEKKTEEKKGKKIKLNQDIIIKIITAIIMLVIISYLANKNSNIFESFKTDISNTSQEEKIQKNENDIESINKGVEAKKIISRVALQEELPEKSPTDGIDEGGFEKNIFNHKIIGAEEYKEKLEVGEYIHIDIRTPAEYNAEKIAEGLNIDYYATDFKEQLDRLDKSKKYIYHCRSGSRSANAVSIFKELGFVEVLELGGGINNWKAKYTVK